MDASKNVGIILAGGGGKGAYEVGAWIELQKVIEECNLNPIAFSGASVGALNAALFSCTCASEAEDVWRGIRPDDIYSGYGKWWTDNVKIRLIYGLLMKYSTNMLLNTGVIRLLKPILKSNDGLFNREGVEKIIKKEIRPEKISLHPIYVSVSQLFDNNKYKCLTKENYVDALLASSALPGVFDRQRINGSFFRYRDGGLTDNLPLKPLLKMEQKCSQFIVIHLEEMPIQEIQIWKTCDIFGCKFYHIFPSESLSGLWGTIDFRCESIDKKIDLGKRDVRKDFSNNRKAIINFFNAETVGQKHLYNGMIYESLKTVYNVKSGKWLKSK